MKSLHDLQKNFTRALFDGEAACIADEIIADGLTPEERFNIYRNNTFITLSQALAQNYPVLCRLVGQAFFDQMAREYVRTYPPQSPVLLCYGDQMAAFLADYPPLADMAYFSDVAKLEQFWAESFNGPDGPAFDLDRLNGLPPDRFNDVIFALRKNLWLMTSEYPVLDIWLVNQEGAAPVREINLDGGGCYLAIYRQGQDVEIMQLDAAGFAFLALLQAGRPVGDAVTRILTQYPDFDLQVALQNILQSGMIEDFALAPEPTLENEND